ELERAPDNVAALSPNGADQLQKRPVVVPVPEQVGQENEKRNQSTEPDPRIQKRAALLGQKEPDHNSQAKDRDGVLLLHAQTSHDAEADPVTRIASLDGQDDELCAAQPEIGLKAVGAKQSAV